MTGDIITLEYNGRELMFREDDDQWSCHALRLHAKNLTALKRKIDKLDSEARRVSVPAVRLDGHNEGSRVDVVLIAKPKDWDRAGYSGDAYNQRVPAVWVLKSGGNQQERVKVSLGGLAHANEETARSLKEVVRLRAESKRLDKEADAVVAAIPRLTLDDLAAKGATEEDLDA